MNGQSETNSGDLTFEFGTFEGFNFHTQSAIPRLLTAAEVLSWNHDREGEAEFWPSGDKPEVFLVFNGREVTASELCDLDRLLAELGDDSKENYLRIHYMLNCVGTKLSELTREALEEEFLHIFFGETFTDLRREAAYALFELYYPEEYQVWEKSTCDGLTFDTDRFLDSPSFSVEEVKLGDEKALIISPG
jgi:hypothetical protein